MNPNTTGTALAPHVAGALSNDVVPWERDYELATKLSKSGLIPAPLRNRPDDVMVVLLTGRELKLTPMLALRSIHVVDGKPVMSADLMAALIVNSGVCGEFRCVEMSEERAVYVARRANEDEATRYEFTKQDAVRAGVMGKTNWRNYPKAMLRARACATAARAHFPDVVAGIYEADSEEIVHQGRAEVVEITDAPKPKRGKTVADLKAEISTAEPEQDPAPAVTPAEIPNGEVATSRGKSTNGSADVKSAQVVPPKETQRADPCPITKGCSGGVDHFAKSRSPQERGLPEPPADVVTVKDEDESQDVTAEWEKVADFLIGKLADVKAKPHLQNLKKKYAAEFDGVKLHAPDALKRLVGAWNAASDRVHTAPPKS